MIYAAVLSGVSLFALGIVYLTFGRLPKSEPLPEGTRHEDGWPYKAYRDFLHSCPRHPLRVFGMAQSRKQALTLVDVVKINWLLRGMKRDYKYVEDPKRDIDGTRQDVWFDMESRSGGDCEDWAITTFRLMVEAGVDPRSMSLGMGATDTGNWHVVLFFDTEKGTYVHDVARRGKLVSWKKCSLKYLSRRIRGIDGAVVYAPAFVLR